MVDPLAENLAVAIAFALGATAGAFVAVLVGSMLLLGSAQWLALGKLVRVLGRHSKPGGAVLVVGLTGWIVAPLIYWAYLVLA